ncbi:hypothetical protein LCGC14_2187610, partial [marine sediment metagenome]
EPMETMKFFVQWVEHLATVWFPVVPFENAIQPVLQFLNDMWKKPMETMKFFFQWVGDLISTAVSFWGQTLGGFDPIVLVQNTFGRLVKWFEEMWTSIKEIFNSSMEWVKNLFLNFTPLNLVIKNFEPITKFFKDIFANIKAIFTGFFDFAKNLFANFNPLKGVMEMLDKLPNFIKKRIGIETEITPSRASPKDLIEGSGPKSSSTKEVIESMGPKSQAKENALAIQELKTESETKIQIDLRAEAGTEAKVTKIQKKKGDAHVNVNTIGYVGALGM